jgi:hypothetical protein
VAGPKEFAAFPQRVAARDRVTRPGCATLRALSATLRTEVLRQTRIASSCGLPAHGLRADADAPARPPADTVAMAAGRLNQA